MPDSLFAGRYRLGELLGRGGMSEVWSATDEELGRRVAVKLLAPHADTARFEREARAVASLTHPNVTQLYDFGSADGRPFMILEFLSGGTLEDRLQNGKPLPDTDAARIAAEIAAGLAHAHDRGVIHRDLKPANVLFDDEGRAKLADFGIARLAAGGGTLTEAGTVLGTAAYISPEQAAGAPAGAASDVYSFGVILYRMLTGRLPFESDDPLELVALHRDAVPPPPSRFRRDAPPLLESTALAALAKDPAGRPSDGRALVTALGGVPGVDRAAPTTVLPRAEAATRVLPRAEAAPTRVVAAARRGTRSRRQLPLVAAALAVLALAGIALAVGLTRPSHDSTPTTTAPPVSLPTTRPSTQATTAPTTATTAPTTTAQTTSSQQTTTQAPPPTTTAPPAPTTTAPPTTETTPTTTAIATTVTVPVP